MFCFELHLLFCDRDSHAVLINNTLVPCTLYPISSVVTSCKTLTQSYSQDTGTDTSKIQIISITRIPHVAFHPLPSSHIPSLTPGHQESALRFYNLVISKMYVNGTITMCKLLVTDFIQSA